MAPYADVRVYLTAPLEVRAKRISERDSIPFEEAKLNIIRREKAHWERFKALYGIDITDLSIFDLVVNTAMFGADEIANFILSALHRS
jgi:cytidylate kinase